MPQPLDFRSGQALSPALGEGWEQDSRRTYPWNRGPSTRGKTGRSLRVTDIVLVATLLCRPFTPSSANAALVGDPGLKGLRIHHVPYPGLKPTLSEVEGRWAK